MAGAASFAEVPIRLAPNEWGIFLHQLDALDDSAVDMAREGGKANADLARERKRLTAQLRSQTRAQLGPDFADDVKRRLDAVYRAALREGVHEIGQLGDPNPQDQPRTVPRFPRVAADTEPRVVFQLRPEEWGLLLAEFEVVESMAVESVDSTGPSERDLARLGLSMVKRVHRQIETALGPALAADLRQQAEDRHAVAFEEWSSGAGLNLGRDDPHRPAP